MGEEVNTKKCNGYWEKFCLTYCDNRKHNIQQMHILLVVYVLVTGLIMLVAGVTEYSAAVAIVSLIPCFLSIVPLFLCGFPHPFTQDENYFFQQGAIYVVFDAQNGGTRMRKHIGSFISGACAFSAPSIIVLLWTDGKLSLIPGLFAIAGLIIIFLAVLLYLCCFHTRRNICLCIDTNDSDEEDEDEFV